MDLLTKMRAQITSSPQGPTVTLYPDLIATLTLRIEDEHRLFHLPPDNYPQELTTWMNKIPGAWAETAGLGLAAQQPPVVVELKATATPVAVRQYPMSQEARAGI